MYDDRYDNYTDGRDYDPRYRYYSELAAKRARRRRRRRALAAFFGVLAVLATFGSFVMIFFRNGSRHTVQTYESPAQDFSEPSAAPQTDTVNRTEVLRYRKSLLDGDEREYYEDIRYAVANHQESVKFSAPDVDRLMEIAKYVYYDYPEYFWFDGRISARFFAVGSLNIGELTLEYPVTEDEARYRIGRIQEITAPVISRLSGCTDYDKVKGVYEYIINNTRYSESIREQSCYSVLAEGRGVCAGYSSAFSYLLNRLGVDSIHVSGLSRGENHAWNLVKVEGQWYQVDCTWGDPVTEDGSDMLTYDYLLLTDGEMGRDHTISDDVPYPACCSVEYNFYIREGLYLAQYSPDAVAGIAERCIYSGRNILMKCADSSVYSETVLRLFDGSHGEIFNILGRVGAGTGNSVNYNLNPEFMTIEILV